MTSIAIHSIADCHPSSAVHCHLPRGRQPSLPGPSAPFATSRLFANCLFQHCCLIYFFSGGGEVQLSWSIATRGEICTRSRSRVRGKTGKMMQQCRAGVSVNQSAVGHLPPRAPPPPLHQGDLSRSSYRSWWNLTPNSTNDTNSNRGMLHPPSTFIPLSILLPQRWISGTLTRRWSSRLGQPCTGLKPSSLVDLSIDAEYSCQ